MRDETTNPAPTDPAEQDPVASSPGQALVPLQATETSRVQRPAPYAPFIAQLAATRLDCPQTRAGRRIEVRDGVSRYAERTRLQNEHDAAIPPIVSRPL